jgi:RNA polymerase sigma factor (sigma-70 family)
MKIKQIEMNDESLRHAAPDASPHRDGAFSAASEAARSAARSAPAAAPEAPSASADLRHAALQRALASGDHRRALELLDALYGDALFRFIRALLRRDDLADDVYQTTLLQAYRGLGDFEARSSVRTWLFGIARHRCLDALKATRRREGRFPPASSLPAAEHEVAADTPPAAQQLSDAQVLAALAHCLDELPAESRVLLLLRFSEGLPYEDLARVCRVSVEALRARVSRTLPLLRRCVERRGQL